MFLWLKTLYRKRAVTWPFIFYTIIWTLSNLMPEWTFEDTLFTCEELKKHNLISGIGYGSEEILQINLSTEAISLLEITFKDKTESVLEFMAKIKNAIPFV